MKSMFQVSRFKFHDLANVSEISEAAQPETCNLKLEADSRQPIDEDQP